MKKNDYIIAISAILFSGLFYGQLAGINFLFFTLLLSAVTAYFNPAKTKEKHWWLYCIFMNVAALSIFVINSDLSVFACLMSILVFSGKSFAPLNSTLVNGVSSVYSILRSPLDIGLNVHRYFNTRQQVTQGHTKKIVFGIIIAILAAFLFLALYMSANPLFANFFNNISFKWLNIEWLLFTVFGFLVLQGILRHQSISQVLQLDATARADIQSEHPATTTPWPGNSITAVALFVMLNLMLLIMNSLDISNIYISGKLPEGINLSDFVQEAVAGLIASVVFGALFLAWFFNGELNFNRYGKPVKLLAYTWIAQNVVVVINTMVRNQWYIEQYHLTGLRIGVFVFLTLTLCGLFFTYRKISLKKSAWWLITSNIHLWFFFLLVFSLFNWDRIVTRYNISHSTVSKPLDKIYLLQLGDANLPEMTELHNSGRFDQKERMWFYEKTLRTYHENRFRQWQSFSLRDLQNNHSLISIELKK